METVRDTARVIQGTHGDVLAEGDIDIDCKVDGMGAMKLKSEFVKKA
ncbi:MAG: PhnA domain-containing protein [Gemmatimonadaceae bacterium]|nr:PhnA domain-containing protein [Gemmatimonadaceae bacterium]